MQQIQTIQQELSAPSSSNLTIYSNNKKNYFNDMGKNAAIMHDNLATTHLTNNNINS